VLGQDHGRQVLYGMELGLLGMGGEKKGLWDDVDFGDPIPALAQLSGIRHEMARGTPRSYGIA